MLDLRYIIDATALKINKISLSGVMYIKHANPMTPKGRTVSLSCETNLSLPAARPEANDKHSSVCEISF